MESIGETATQVRERLAGEQRARQEGFGPIQLIPPPPPGKVYAAVHAVMAALGRLGIDKARQNEDQQYWFRGIDQVYEALNPLLVQHRLLILPEAIEHRSNLRETRSGGTMVDVCLGVRYHVISTEDGSRLPPVVVWGEGADTSDKATNKASSASYKYMALQVFCIPLEGVEDGDRTSPGEERAVQGGAARPRPPAEYDEFVKALEQAARHGTAELTRIWRSATEPMRAYYDADPRNDRDALRAIGRAADAEAQRVG